MADEEVVVLITGSTDGLGKLTAHKLATRGMTVLLHGRNPEKGRTVVEETQRATGNRRLRYYNADLASLRETAELAKAIMADSPRLNILINNAGIGPKSPDSPREESPDGHEKFLAVNYLSGYLLSYRLLPLLRQSAPSRIINVASIGQHPIDFEDVMLRRNYDDARAYRQSKLAQIMFTFDLAAEMKDTGVTVNCLHPGTLMNTAMVFNSTYFPGPMTSVEQGADALEYLTLSSDLSDVTGAYFDGKKVATANPQAYDVEARTRLRELSESLEFKSSLQGK
jgi:NAD(P)-dependent dehydrogenase (short-subunit alcohol dehydrogenase family)